jgi:MFS family permease
MNRHRPTVREDQRSMGAHLRVESEMPQAFKRLLTAAWASNLGDGVRNAALPLIAASLTDSASTVTAVIAATTLPFALFGMLAGTLADRRARVPLIVGAHLFRAVIMGAMAALLLVDGMSVGFLVAGAFLLGCGEAVADSAAPALLPDLVEDRLEDANGELETAELVGNDLVGPPMGSVLFSVAAAAPFALDAVSFVGAAGLVASVERDETEVDEAPLRSWREDLREGVATAWTNPVLRVTGALIVVLQLGNLAAIAPIVLYVTERLGVDPAAYGLFLAVGSLGGIAGSRVAAPLARRFGPFATLVGSIAVSVVSFLLMAVPTVVTAGLGFALSFGAVVVGRIVTVTARQRSVPSRLLGRAQGAIRTGVWGAASVGAVIGGALADAVSDQAPFLLAAALYATGLLIGWRPLRRVLPGR